MKKDELQEQAEKLANDLDISVEEASKALRRTLGVTEKRFEGPLRNRVENPPERSQAEIKARRVKNKARRKQRQKRHPRIHGRRVKVRRVDG